MEDSWITVILASVFLASTSEAKTSSEGEANDGSYLTYLIATLVIPPVALAIFLYLLVSRKEKPRSFKLFFLYSILMTAYLYFMS